jgi:hypothetical protein
MVLYLNHSRMCHRRCLRKKEGQGARKVDESPRWRWYIYPAFGKEKLNLKGGTKTGIKQMLNMTKYMRIKTLLL